MLGVPLARPLLALSMAVLALFLSACGEDSSSEPTTGSGGQSAVSSKPDKPVRIGFSSWIGYGAFHVAEKKGFFDKRGVEVDITVSEDTSQRLIALKAGRLDATATTVDTIAAAAARGTPLVQVTGVDASNGGDGIIATKDIKSVADMRGKPVAVHQGTIEEFFLAYVLDKNGMTLDDVKINNLKPDDAGAAFAAGKVPVAVTYEPWLSRAKQNPNGQVLVSTKDFPDLIVDTLAFSREYTEKHPASVKAFLAAYEDAVQFIKTNPDEANEIMAQVADQKPEELAEQLKSIRFYSKADSQELFGTPDTPGPLSKLFTEAGEFWKQTGETPTVAAADEHINASFLGAEAP